MSGVDPRACRCAGLPPHLHASQLRLHRVTLGLEGSPDSRAETDPIVGAVTGETGVASVDTLRETATLTRIRDAARRQALVRHELATDIRRALAEGHAPEDIAAALGVTWPGVPS